MVDSTRAKALTDLLASLAEPNRLRIIEILKSGSKNVTELSTMLESEIVNVSHHLSVLRGTGLVQDKKKGRFVIYSLHPNVFDISDPSRTVMDIGWCRIEIPNF